MKSSKVDCAAMLTPIASGKALQAAFERAVEAAVSEIIRKMKGNGGTKCASLNG